MPDRPGILGRLTGRYALLVVGLWVLAAAVANVAVPQLERVVDSHARSFMPPSAPSAVAAARAAQLFDQTPSNNFVYVVLERNQRLGAGDRQFYDALAAALGSDHRHVYAVTDLWSQPATAAGAQSTDGQAVSVMVRLAGMLGTAQARDSVNAVRATAQKLGRRPACRSMSPAPAPPSSTNSPRSTGRCWGSPPPPSA
ncbi:MMPL family protein [Mycobacterium avium subsp. avium 2285 (R)]|nr:MMPL family protein [Mycobacterium avium subsp. avium 2285 (R)]